MRSTFLAGLALFLCATGSFPQQTSMNSQNTQQQEPAATPAGTPTLPNAPVPTPKHDVPKPLRQPKRILGIMPNYRAVSAGAIPPPPRPKEAFRIATLDTFDYSAFIFVGITSLGAEGILASHPTFGKGVGGFGDYYWHGFLDKASGNYMVVWALPGLLHEDERYYAMGEGPLLKRSVYAASRILITPNYHGKNTFNAAEILGRGISQAVSLTYYPSSTQTVGGFSEKYAYALGRDALTDVFREIWPDLAHHLKRHKAR
ncbi:MAG TPA: hypothetical protein VHU89_14840 [Acidobacteriaceae bacterium]|nr:hypothetical protein [Acidobacteriaceae bacterium]